MESIYKLFERAKQGLSFYGNTQKALTERFRNLPQLSHFKRLIELLNILQNLANSTQYISLNPANIRVNFSQKDEVRLGKVYKYIEENYTQKIGIQSVAKIYHLTIPLFCNYFKKNINQTYTDFTNEYRINQACKMLLENLKIMDICYHCGFSHISYFGSVFKQFRGINPYQFRKNFGKP